MVSAGAFSSLAASARRELAVSVARVLKPGGVFVFIERSELLVMCSVIYGCVDEFMRPQSVPCVAAGDLGGAAAVVQRALHPLSPRMGVACVATCNLPCNTSVTV